MKRRYVDTEIYDSRNIIKDGNVDYKYWFDKDNDERVRAAGIMTSVAFGEPDFFEKRLDRTIFFVRKLPE